MTLAENWRLYRARVEPRETKGNGQYIDVRTCDDIARLQALEDHLKEHSKDAVLVPWISPPYGFVRGYGIYSCKEAQKLCRRAEEECWGFPTVGAGYDLTWFKWKIRSVSNNHHVSASR